MFRLRQLLLGCAFLVAVLLGGQARADLEWRGMIERNGEPTFALVDTSSGTTKWVPLRGGFLGFTVESYDPQRQLLVLTKEGGRSELTLTSGKTAPGAPTAQEDLRTLTGMPLAEELAKRGDPQLKDLLAQHRAAVLKMEELSRRLLEAEKAEREQAATEPKSQGRQSARPSAAVSPAATLRKAFEDAEQQAAGLSTEIERAASQKRDAMVK